MPVSPDSVYGTAWSTSTTVVEHVAVVVREPPDWLPPRQKGEAIRVLSRARMRRVWFTIMRHSLMDH